MLTPSQSRAARGWLDWSQEKLSIRASVSISTVRDFEHSRRSPIKNNLQAMLSAFEAAGIRMLMRDGVPAGVEFDPALVSGSDASAPAPD